jgi:hypothetical protein
MIPALKALIGVEHSIDEVSHALRNAVRSLHPTVVGAHQINCSDESERECVESFHRIIVRDMLPELKYWSRSSFRTVNLGARYEPQSIAMAENHFSTPDAEGGLKALICKLNSHVSVVDGDDGLICGKMHRYEKESVYCGALHALLAGAQGPSIDDLRAAFNADGIDRVAQLLDESVVPPTLRALFAAVVNAQLQSSLAISEVLEMKSHTPTFYVIVASVTLNREAEDTELVVGIETIDERNGEREIDYVGLADDARSYELATSGSRLRLSEAAYCPKLRLVLHEESLELLAC